ncbi:probable inactive ribonuclease-like protein 12 [Anolis carolinensis]|uniref:Ribonuclease A-domain domain-containing protein n=1 Tax=Anolis carolinensis TaxID=28377 RepID=H9GUE9_ANOCA|nr:PREDICTED: ribonuclease [Anolis carolinensis]XP_016850855.1 PREDICTED: ribonuclease [Anolis carolinensis]|eukprot:XP_003223918.2 PREDICTED: ribonuclease [Anolis carolinensis]
MAGKNTCFGLTMALFVVSVWLALASAKSYQKFLREHVDYPVTQVPDIQHYCSLMMKRRNMAKPNYCKHLNTFLHVDTPEIQAVCGQAGEPTTGDLRESQASFPMTVCHLQKGSWAPDCQYQGTQGIERVVIACEEGFPVHLETELPDY